MASIGHSIASAGKRCQSFRRTRQGPRVRQSGAADDAERALQIGRRVAAGSRRRLRGDAKRALQVAYRVNVLGAVVQWE